MYGSRRRAGYGKSGRPTAECPSVPVHKHRDSGTEPRREGQMATNPSIKSLAFQVLRESALRKRRSKDCPNAISAVGQQSIGVEALKRPACTLSPDLVERIERSAKQFPGPHARLFPLLGKKVWTFKGPGILLQVF